MPMRYSNANFSKGEISEELVARVDVATYSTALRRANNVIVLKYGGVAKRPGTRVVAEVYADQGVRLLPFQFSMTQTYVLEMGQGYMRAAALGGLVVEDKLSVEAVTRLFSTEIRQSHHGYSQGDQVYFEGVLGCDWLNGCIARVIDITSPHTYTIDIDSRDLDPFIGDTGGTVRSVASPPPPQPPVVPPPAADPPPPEVGGGGYYDDGGGGGGGFRDIRTQEL